MPVLNFGIPKQPRSAWSGAVCYLATHETPATPGGPARVRLRRADTDHPRTSHKTVTHHTGTKVKVKTKHATGTVVYYCNSGNTVEYYT